MRHAILNTKTDDCSRAVYVARPSPLGNPYAIGPDGDRDAVIERYRRWLDARVAERDPVVCTALLGILPGQPLACCCKPARCHAEVIAEMLDTGVQGRLRDRGHKTMRYAGIGSRATPEPVLQVMRKAAYRLSALGYTLLSGAADGADSAFEQGSSPDKREIYLPWPDFRKRSGAQYIDYPSAEAFRVAALVHPVWKRLKDPAQALMARNSHQALGADLRTPVDFVVCWTQDGCEREAQREWGTGGTGQAIALADRWRIPVINLQRGVQEGLQRISLLINERSDDE